VIFVYMALLALNGFLVVLLVTHSPKGLVQPQVACWWVLLIVVLMHVGYAAWRLIKLLC